MISIFQIFKIIFGLIVATFFLYFILNFTGVYSSFQLGQQKVQIIKNFGKAVQDVYVFDTPMKFTDFSLTDDRVEYNPPYVSFGELRRKIEVPLFLVPGKEVYVYRGELNLGWWKVNWIGALPTTTVILNPLTYSPRSWDAMRGLVRMFPQTQNPEISFGFCSGEELYDTYDRDYFLRGIRDRAELGFIPCNATLPRDHVLVTINDYPANTTAPSSGLLVVPNATGLGYAVWEGETYLYKDPLDLFSLLTGGSRVYAYKNSAVLSELQLASVKETQRAQLMVFKGKCLSLHEELAGVLCGASQNTICNIAASGNYTHPVAMAALANLSTRAEEIYLDLEGEGCD